MILSFDRIEAVTLDFYNTLAALRGQGRGRSITAYLEQHGFPSDPWEHAVIYDILDRHHLDYAPDATAEAKQVYWTGLAERLFHRLNVRAPARAAADHAQALWQILGPASFSVYPDVPDTLRDLKAAGYPLAVVSNWQCGLSNYCVELGIRDAFDHVVVSAEFGCEKPDARIFREACTLLGKPPDRVLHIGDTITDDVEGARAAGLHAVLLCRKDQPADVDVACISSLSDIADLLGLRDLTP